MRRLAFAAAALGALILLFVVLRPGGEEESPPMPPSTTATTTTTMAALATTNPAEPDSVAASVVVRGGAPVDGGPKRLSVRQDKVLALTVDADVADQVHVHGYDLTRAVAPGQPARFRFRTSIAGRFEIELEQAHVHIAELEVRP